MNNLIDDYSKEIECSYENELYSVRDNGSIMRHRKENGRKRQIDDVWTFGKVDSKTGYMLFSGIRGHRIVATAFHGEAPTKEYIVDHINTNKQDNRLENLRWITKLENIMEVYANNNEFNHQKTPRNLLQ